MKKQISLILIFALFIFKVEAQSLTLPYYTGFDSTSERAGWMQFRMMSTLTSSDWGINGGSLPNTPSLPYHLDHGKYIDGIPDDTVEDWYISPPLKISTPSKLKLKCFLSAPEGYSHGEYFGIWLGSKNNNPDSGNFKVLADLTVMNPQEQWLDTTINITSFSDTAYIAFKYKCISYWWFAVGIDNISIVSDTPSLINNKSVEKSMVNIYPNPMHDMATIYFQNFSFSKNDFIIYNVFGQIVHSQTLNSKRETLNLNLESGIYFYKVMNRREEIGRGKIIIQKP